MKLEPVIEEKLKTKVLALLETGRPGWDIPHTLATVHWIKKLIELEGGDERIFVTTMYLHDIGYSKVNDTLLDQASITHAKKDHVKNGISISKPILEELRYSKEEIKEILHLIEIHDHVEQLTTKNEFLVFEADSLGQIDVDRVTSQFDKENIKKFLTFFEKNRIPRFTTTTGKKYLQELFSKAKEYYEYE